MILLGMNENLDLEKAGSIFVDFFHPEREMSGGGRKGGDCV